MKDEIRGYSKSVHSGTKMRYAALLSASEPRDLYHSLIPAFLLVSQRPPEILLSTTGRRREPSCCNAGSRGGVQLVDARQQPSLP